MIGRKMQADPFRWVGLSDTRAAARAGRVLCRVGVHTVYCRGVAGCRGVLARRSGGGGFADWMVAWFGGMAWEAFDLGRHDDCWLFAGLAVVVLAVSTALGRRRRAR